MSSNTAENLIKYLQALDLTTEVIAIIIGPDDIKDNYGLNVETNHWQKIVNSTRTDYAVQMVYEEFSEAVSNVLSDYKCAECDYYDYEVLPNDNGDTVCKTCGEEQDIIL